MKGFKSKSISGEDDYKCKLSKELQEMARVELRETEETRKNALKTIRDWANKNERLLKLRLDSNFLLRFLRAKKFSIPMAQESIERYVLLRNANYEFLFKNLDMKIPHMKELFDLGFLFAVPKRDELGRRVIIYRPGVFDPHKHTNIDFVKIHGIVFESLLEDEENQIRGFVHIIDGAGVGFSHLTLFTPKEAVRIAKNAERILPMRHKEFHALNVPTALSFAVDFGLGLISEKLKKRFNFYNKEEVLRDVDRNLLPMEYGGTQKMSEMIELFQKELKEKQSLLKSHDTMCCNLEMYSDRAREGAISALRYPLNCPDKEPNSYYGLQGSFRKLEVD